MAIRYKTLVEDSLAKLDQTVNRHLDEGWWVYDRQYSVEMNWTQYFVQVVTKKVSD